MKTTNITNYKLTTINAKNYLQEVSDDKNAYQKYNSLRNKYLAFQKNSFYLYKFNEDFSTTFTIWENNKKINYRFNYEEFIEKIKQLLNTNNINDLKKQIEKLKLITTEEDLKQQFPLIHEDYTKGNELFKDFQVKLDFTDLSTKEDRTITNQALKKREYYYNCGLRFYISYFIKEQAKLYSNILNNLKKIKEYIDNNPFFLDNYVNHNKENLYLANKYIDELSTCKNNELQKIYLQLINNYLKNNKNDNTLIHDEKGLEITYNDILRKYNEFLNSSKEIEEGFVDWVLIPDGESLPDEKSKVTLLDRVTINTNPNPNITKYENANNRKLKFYEENPYNKTKCLAKAKGLCLNKGYTAYIYENGEILLDRIASESNLISSYGNAIYNLNIYNFEKLSKIDKVTLRKEKMCPIIIHDKNWEQNAQYIIDKPTTEENKEAAKKLVRKIKNNTI